MESVNLPLYRKIHLLLPLTHSSYFRQSTDIFVQCPMEYGWDYRCEQQPAGIQSHTSFRKQKQHFVRDCQRYSSNHVCAQWKC